MAILDHALVDGAQFVARVVEYQVRQAASTALSTALSTADQATPAPTTTSAMSSIMSTASSTSPPPTSSNPLLPNNDKNNSGSGSSSPLLFFVALGFGVVFTNLWIIVGVKYCFRYNARNRALARVDENGEPIDLQNMPTRPHRRRREKKLMTMDEVNEKFPMVKYKTWVLERRRDGLPAEGGILVSPSRANSMRSVRGIVPEHVESIRQSNDEQTKNADPTSEATAQHHERADDKETEPSPSNETTRTTDATDVGRDATTDKPAVSPPTTVDDATAKDARRPSEEDDEEDDDDHVHSGIDPDMMGNSGDTCAICIDTLEDNDDVRGLTCGHAFHAVCLDPWLTNRRACCPLCKADYYTPKVRSQPTAEGGNQDPNAPGGMTDPSRNNHRMNYPRAPAHSFTWSHFRDAPRQIFPTRFDGSQPGNARRARQRPGRPDRRHAPNQAPGLVSQDGNQGNTFVRFRNRFPPWRLEQLMRRNRNRGAPNNNAANDSPVRTPSQLEAGVRPSNT
ncbi:hypothetical protein F5Y17DRAFT_362608 [Xylariaceae sp. FL0594]|nr:hypothetical protein F5Y17DRAFT_362608 [Xylariaceae sp. FL0594]